MYGFKKSDMKFFELAKSLAETSDYPLFRMGCVLVYKGRVIGKGINSNKTCPQQKKYNRKYRKFRESGKPIHDSLHAEIAALRDVPYPVDQSIDWSRVRVYVYRISPGKPSGHGLARPCPGCMNALKDKGVRHILYTGDDSMVYEQIGL